jgi:hypothetical protein
MVPEAEEECRSSDDGDKIITGRHAAAPRPEDDLKDSVSDDEDKDDPSRKAAAVDAKDFLTDDCIEQETILEDAGYHVMQAKAMRCGQTSKSQQQLLASVATMKCHMLNGSTQLSVTMPRT